MIIGYDGKRAMRNLTGLGNYSRFILEGIAKTFPQDNLVVYSPKASEIPRVKPLKKLRNVKLRIPGFGGLRGAWWRSFGVTRSLKRDKVQIFHGLSNELPLNIRRAGIPSVLTVHDLIFRRLPECYSAIDRKIYDYKYGRSCRNATHIVAISERTKKDIMEIYGIPEKRISVIYQGCDASFREPWTHDQLLEIQRRYNLPKRYMLQVGTVEKRKNLELTLRGMSRLSDKEISLVVVGRDFRGYKEEMKRLARELGLEQRVIWLEGLPFRDLPGIYQAATLALYPSRYEGFGIPVLEALSSGIPMVCATGSCLEEAGGDAPIYVDPDDDAAMASAMELLLTNVNERVRRIDLGRRHVLRFDDATVAATLMALYRRLLRL